MLTRSLLVCFVLTACSEAAPTTAPDDDVRPALDETEAEPAPPSIAEGAAALLDRYGDPGMESAQWDGSWVGTREVLESTPTTLSREHVRVSIERQDGATMTLTDLSRTFTLTLVVGPNQARSEGDDQERATVLGAPTGANVQTIRRQHEVAVFVRGGHLYYARILESRLPSGARSREVSVADLTPEPPPPELRAIEGVTDLSVDPQPTALAQDDSRLYWISYPERGLVHRSAIRAIAKTGGEAELLTDELQYARDIAVADGYVYVVDFRAQELARIPASGGSLETLATIPGAEHVAVGEHEVFVATSRGQIMAVPRDGGDPVERFTAPADTGVVDVVAHGRDVFTAVRASVLADDAPDQVLRIDPQGRATVIAGDGVCADLHIGGRHLYWNTCGGPIRRAPLRGGAARDVVPALPDVEGLAVSGDTLYFLLGAGRGGIRSAPAGGGAVETILDGRFDPDALVADDDALYLLDIGLGGREPGRIGRVPR